MLPHSTSWCIILLQVISKGVIIMEWKVFKLDHTRRTGSPFVSISTTGQFDFNSSACTLVNDQQEHYQYAQFLEAENNGKTVLGVRFSHEKSEDSIVIRHYKQKGKHINSMSVACSSFYNKHFRPTKGEATRLKYDVEKEDDNTLIILKK